MLPWVAVLLPIALFGGVPVAAALAQSGLVGRVTNESGVAIADADVRVGNVETVARSNAHGWFTVPDAPLGLMYFGVRRLGYRPAARLLRLAEGDTIDIVLESLRFTLDTVRVQGRADAAWERELDRYRLAVASARHATVLTEADIAKRRPSVTSDLFRRIAGFTVQGGGAEARVLGRARCVPTVVLDGQPAPGYSVNDIPPQSIRLLVAYRNFTLMPMQWQGQNSNPTCGGIAIFTL